MSDHLYVLRFNHLSGQRMYFTTYLQEKTLLISTPDKSTIGLLRDTLLHHHDVTRSWINRGVFYRTGGGGPPAVVDRRNKSGDTLHLTDHTNFDKKTRALDFLMNTPVDEPLLSVEAFALTSPRDMDRVRDMYYFANTSLFVMDDYEYTPNNSHLSVQGLLIELPEADKDVREETHERSVVFLESTLLR